MMEVQIAPFEYGKIEWNYNEVKAELDKELEQFRNPTKLEKKSAKEVVSFLNKVSKAISDKAISIDKELNVPIKSFRSEVKELNEMIDEVKKPYDSYLYAQEEIRKKEKEALIHDIYDYNIGEFKEIIPLQRIWNEKWLNATYKPEEIANEIKTMVINTREAFSAIDRMDLRYPTVVKWAYVFFGAMDSALGVEDQLITGFVKEDDGIPYTKKAEITASDSEFEALVDFCQAKGIDIKWL